MEGLLKKMRTEKNLTQEELARKIGVTTQGYQLMEYGKRIPSVRTAIRIADALGVHDLRTLWDSSPHNDCMSCTSDCQQN